MRQIRRSIWSSGVAFVAAYLLVLQALIGAFALGAANAGPMVDTFGNPLCIAGSVQTDTNARDHAALPDCCTSACSMFGSFAPDGKAPHSLANPLSSSAQAEFLRDSTVVRQTPEHDPGSPRAPPQAA